MKPRITARWLAQFASAAKLHSYLDKKTKVMREPNPYYVMEWFLFPFEESADAVLASAVEFHRSPGLGDRPGDFMNIFTTQLVPDVLLTVPTEAEERLWATAAADIRRYAGEDLWKQGTAYADEAIRIAGDRWARFQKETEEAAKQAEDEYAARKEELTRECPDPDERARRIADLQLQLQRKLTETPRKLLIERYADAPFVALFHFAKERDPHGKLQALRLRLEAAGEDGYRSRLAFQPEPQQLERAAGETDAERDAFFRWVSAAISESEMSRLLGVTVERRSMWGRWLDAVMISRADKGADQSAVLSAFEAEAADVWFRARGDMLPSIRGEQEIPDWLTLQVLRALTGPSNEERTKRLRDDVILKNWPSFASSLMQAEEWPLHLSTLAWVFILDPYSFERRLLRAKGKDAEGANTFAERLGEVYSLGLRAGLHPEIIRPQLLFLADHLPEQLLSLAFKAQHVEDLVPLNLLGAEPLHLLLVRVGEARASSARSRVAELTLRALAGGEIRMLDEDPSLWRVWLLPEKGHTVRRWIELTGRAAAGQTQSHRRAWRWLENALLIHWLGAHLNSPEEEHHYLEQLISANSDWVSFESDAASRLSASGLRYRIVRPGALDTERNEPLARVEARAELADQAVIQSVLDDLKDL